MSVLCTGVSLVSLHLTLPQKEKNEKTDEAMLPPAGLGPTHYPQFSGEMGGNLVSPHLNRFP